MKFSQTEVRDIIVSTAILAFAFGGINGFPEALMVVGIAFLSHELLGHKLVAQRLGAEAEYRAWPTGLLIALAGSLVGFVFAAPGAVYFSQTARGGFAWTVHRFSKKEVGMIGLAGPVVNIAIGIASFLLFSVTSISLLARLASISFFLAFFNLLPFGPLDGQKVMQWDRRIWATAIGLSAVGYLF